MRKSYVMEGKYKNCKIAHGNDTISIICDPYIAVMNKLSISSYTVIDEFNKEEYSFWDGAVGVALWGEFGAVAGIGGKQSKEYLISIEWKEGEKSLIYLDEENYKVFVKNMF